MKRKQLSLKYLFNIISDQKWLVLLSLLSSLIYSIIAALAPTILKNISNIIFNFTLNSTSMDFKKIAQNGIILISCYIFSLLISIFQGFIISKIVKNIELSYRNKIIEKINSLPMSYFDIHNSEDITSMLINDVESLSQALYDSLNKLISSFFVIVSSIIMMFINDIYLSLMTIAMMPISALIIFIIVKFSQKFFFSQQKLLAETSETAREVFFNKPIINVLNQEKKEIERFKIKNKRLSSNSMKANFFSSFLHPIMNFVGNVSYVVIALFGSYLALKRNDPIFITTIVAFITYQSKFNDKIAEISSFSSSLQTGYAASERINSLLTAIDDIDSSSNKKIINGDITFKNVSFSYGDKEILHNLNFTIKKGQKVAIVGPTGSGKSTLISILLGFYSIQKGSICINNEEITNFKKENLRSLFSTVLQEPWIFQGSVKENICLGDDIPLDVINNSCYETGLNNFIDSYDNNTSQLKKLSQGEKQLISISRAMAHQKSIIVFDEATSSVDTKTEKTIQNAIDNLLKNKTSIIIAHRLSTIKNADVIFVLKDGNIVEKGNHDFLIKKQGFYYQLYTSQFDNA